MQRPRFFLHGSSWVAGYRRFLSDTPRPISELSRFFGCRWTSELQAFEFETRRSELRGAFFESLLSDSTIGTELPALFGRHLLCWAPMPELFGRYILS